MFQPGGGCLLQLFRLAYTHDRCGASREPEWSNQEIDGVSEESGLISFDCVSDKLQDPANDKQHQGPTPVEKEKRQRHDDRGDADAVRETVQRMLMFRLIAG